MMNADTFSGYAGAHLEVIAKAERAARAIPPLWPLSSSVAVNPFLGQTAQSLSQVGALLERVGGQSVTMPRAWYRGRIDAGEITLADLEAAAVTAGLGMGGAELGAAASAERPAIAAAPTVASLAADVSGIDWPAIIAERFGAWAAGYFDAGQALWVQTPGKAAFDSWREFASRDLSPEIAGLAGFGALVASAPKPTRNVLVSATDALGLTAENAETYFHQLLMELGGWAQVGRYKLWQAELAGDKDATTTDLLSIRLMWEQALFAQYRDQIDGKWAEVLARHAQPPVAGHDQQIDAALQLAAEHAAQRKLAATLAHASQPLPEGRAALQAAFCIDVRSKVFRRALESLDPNIQTMGFAGFFGLATQHRDHASDINEHRLPVLLNHALESATVDPLGAAAENAARFSARAKRAWGRFKLAAVSSFAFVEASGPLYMGKLLRDALGLEAHRHSASPKPVLDASVSNAQRIAAAGNILRAMSLTEKFAPLVLLVGHGAHVVNNPHESALHCGACGGYAGDVNARLLAGLLNDKQVRAGLADQGIVIPVDTVFLGCLHETTTDTVIIFEQDAPHHSKDASILRAQNWLAAATQIARAERALRLPRAESGDDIAKRSTDWSETRPEWALAGCQAFIAAPRARTRGKGLEGRAFLHDYVWQQDEGFGVLELILTAPVVVASWISLQYYGSVVAPQAFGGGNKLLHNVTGGIGVVEGNGGPLRGGLPWQSVHDGEALAHDPLRLSICVEAPKDAINRVLMKHPQVRDLFDNQWLHLFTLDANGQMDLRYQGGLTWSPAQRIAAAPQAQVA